MVIIVQVNDGVAVPSRVTDTLYVEKVMWPPIFTGTCSLLISMDNTLVYLSRLIIIRSADLSTSVNLVQPSEALRIILCNPRT